MKISITSGIQITIYVEDTEDQMKVDSSTRPSDVCSFFVKKHNLSLTTSWALFETINNGLFGKNPFLGHLQPESLNLQISVMFFLLFS